MDIYPILVDLIWNKKPTQPKDGISLLPILTGKQTERGGYIGFGTSENHMVIMDDQYKLHRIKEKETIRWELYDLINDIGEKNNIADANPKIMKRLKKQFSKWNFKCEDDLRRLRENDD